MKLLLCIFFTMVLCLCVRALPTFPSSASSFTSPATSPAPQEDAQAQGSQFLCAIKCIWSVLRMGTCCPTPAATPHPTWPAKVTVATWTDSREAERCRHDISKLTHTIQRVEAESERASTDAQLRYDQREAAKQKEHQIVVDELLQREAAKQEEHQAIVDKLLEREAVKQEEHQIVVDKLLQRLELVEQLRATKDMLLTLAAGVAVLIAVQAVTYFTILKRRRPAVNANWAMPNSRGTTLEPRQQERQFPLQEELLAITHVIGRHRASVAKGGKAAATKRKAERTAGGKKKAVLASLKEKLTAAREQIKTLEAKNLRVRQRLTDETARRKKREQALEVLSAQHSTWLEAQLVQVGADMNREEASATQLKEQVGEAQARCVEAELKCAAMEVKMATLYGTIDAGEKQAATQASSFKKMKEDLATSGERIKILEAECLRMHPLLINERAQRKQREQELEVADRRIKAIETRAKASADQLHNKLAKQQEAIAAQLQEAQAQREAVQRKCAAAEAKLEKVQGQCDEMEGDMYRQTLAAGQQNAANEKLLIKWTEEANAQIDGQAREINRLRAELQEKEKVLAQMTHQLMKEAAERAIQGNSEVKIQKLTKKLTTGGERIKALEADVLRVRQLFTDETARCEESEQALNTLAQRTEDLEAHANAREAQLRREHNNERELWEVKETEWRHRVEVMMASAAQLKEQEGEAQARCVEAERRCADVEAELEATKRAASGMKTHSEKAEAWAKARKAQLEHELAEEKAATVELNLALHRMHRGIEEGQQQEEAHRLLQTQNDAELQAKDEEIGDQAGEINRLKAELRRKEEALADSAYQLTLLQRQMEFAEQRAAANDASLRHRQESIDAELKQARDQLADLND